MKIINPMEGYVIRKKRDGQFVKNFDYDYDWDHMHIRFDEDANNALMFTPDRLSVFFSDLEQYDREPKDFEVLKASRITWAFEKVGGKYPGN